MKINVVEPRDLVQIFETEFARLPYSQQLISYLTGVFVGQLTERQVASIHNSVVLDYYEARGDFVRLQRLGDRIVWTGGYLPAFHEKHRDVHEEIGRKSYLACHRILGRTWPLFEELADEFPAIIVEIQHSIRSVKTTP